MRPLTNSGDGDTQSVNTKTGSHCCGSPFLAPYGDVPWN